VAGERAAALVADLRTRAAALEALEPGAAGVIQNISDQLERIARTQPSDLEEHFFALEETLLASCRAALSSGLKKRIEERAQDLAQASGATEDSLERTYRAMLDRETRAELELPRLEIG
jgi:hypothetical protein